MDKHGLSLPFYGTVVYVQALYQDNSSTVTLTKSQTTNVTLWLQWSDGYQEPATYATSITSNSGVATVSGSTATRTITAQEPGTAQISAKDWVTIDEFGNTGWIYSAQKTVQVKWTLVLNVINSNLTVAKTNGTIDIIATANTVTGQYSGSKPVSIGISNPVNPNNVALTSGATGKSCEFNLTAGAVSGECRLTVSTSSTNTNSGTLTYTVAVSSTDPNVATSGSPKQVTVTTQP